MAQHIETRNLTRTLPVKLTEKELAQKATELVEKLVDKQARDDARKAAATTARETIKELDEEVRTLTRTYRRGAEDREVKCREERDQRLGEVRVVRLDTKEVIERRPMTSEERQTKLPGVDSGTGGRKPAKRRTKASAANGAAAKTNGAAKPPQAGERVVHAELGAGIVEGVHHLDGTVEVKFDRRDGELTTVPWGELEREGIKPDDDGVVQVSSGEVNRRKRARRGAGAEDRSL